MTADVHYLDDGGVFVREHIGYAAAMGGVCCDAVVAWHHHFAFVVVFNLDFSVGEILFLSFCFIVSLVGTFSARDGTFSDGSFNLCLMWRLISTSITEGML